MMRFIFLLFSAVLLSSCAKDDNSEPPAELVEFEQTLEVNELWSVSTGDGVGDLFVKIFPFITNNKIIVTDRSGHLTAIDLETGKKLWETELNIIVSGGIGGNDSHIVITSRSGQVVLVNTEGKILWKVDASSEVLMPAQIAGGLIIIRSVDGLISALNLEDGSEKWTYRRDVPALSLRGNSSPIIKQGYIFNGLDNGRLVALDLLDGHVVFDIAIANVSGRSELERLADIDGYAVIEKDTLYMVGYQGRVVSIDIKRGQLSWSRKLSSYSGVSYSKSGLHISDDKDFVWALDSTNGATLWKQDKLKARHITRPISIKKSIVVADFEAYLHFMSPFDGHFQARVETNASGVIVPPIEHNGRLYMLTRNGELYAFELGEYKK